VRDLKRKAEGRHRIDLRDRLDGVQNLFGQRFFQPKRRGILPEETTMIEIARQKFGVIGFDRLQIRLLMRVSAAISERFRFRLTRSLRISSPADGIVAQMSG
jgi:hypothetical protein